MSLIFLLEIYNIMKKRFIAIGIIIVFVILFFYLTHVKLERFDYELDPHNYSWGEISAILAGSEHGTIVTGSPYELFMVAYISNDINIKNAFVNDINIYVGDKSKSIWQSVSDYIFTSHSGSNLKTIKGKKIEGHYYTVGITSLELPHETIVITLSFILETAESIIQEDIEYRLKPKYSVEEGNIILFILSGV